MKRVLYESQKDQNSLIKSAHLWWWCYAKPRKLPSKPINFPFLPNPSTYTFYRSTGEWFIVRDAITSGDCFCVRGGRGSESPPPTPTPNRRDGTDAKLHFVYSSRLPPLSLSYYIQRPGLRIKVVSKIARWAKWTRQLDIYVQSDQMDGWRHTDRRNWTQLDFNIV